MRYCATIAGESFIGEDYIAQMGTTRISDKRRLDGGVEDEGIAPLCM